MSNVFKKSDLRTGHRVTFEDNSSSGTYTKIVFINSSVEYVGKVQENFLLDPTLKSYNWSRFENLKEENILKVEVANHPYDIFYHSSGWKTIWEKQIKTPEQLAYEEALEQLELAKQKVEALNPNK